jgi:hypothetical protein
MAAKSIAEKLQIKPDTTVWVSPFDHLELVGTLPHGVRQSHTFEDATVAIIFVDGEATARARLDRHRHSITKPSILWVAYPKGNRADINRDSLWPILGEYGMRPNGQVAVDATWSALRFRPLKPGEEPFSGGH